MTRVALFGGSFNPPHVAHQLVALYVLETCEVDELWFVPTWLHPFGKPLAPYPHRIAMCELACGGLGPRAKVSRAEEAIAQRPGFVSSRTLDLVEMLVESEGMSFRLVIGSDILDETDKWYRWDDLVALAPPIVVARAGARVGGSFGPVMPDISATKIREMLVARDRSVAELLPRSVLGYIAAHGLYSL